MPSVVMKFGGSSVASVEKIRTIADRLVARHREGIGVVAVVSAMGNTTNDLLALVREVSQEPPRRELDMLLSVGERITMALLSTAIHDCGESAISFTGSQVGIITTDNHANARIVDVRPFRIEDELLRGRIVIVAGFQGTSYKREITTLGRGGSDTTAVALAAALDADCEIYSDVAGVYSADPRVVVDARRLDTISYDEMQELARHGAKVLNQQAIEFARSRRINIYARSTFGQGDEQTVVTQVVGAQREAERLQRGFWAAGVASSRRRCLVVADGVAVDEFLAVIGTDALVSLNVSAGRGVALVATDNAPDPASVGHRLAGALAHAATVHTNIATVTVVGAGTGSMPAAVAAAAALATELGCDLHSLIVSDDAITLVVPQEWEESLCRLAHERFIGQGAASH
jgi:aspartate kinase